MYTLTEIELEIREIAKKINAPEQYLPTFGFTEGNARPHIETHGDEFHYVINERGEEYKRVKTEDFNELLFLVFADVTFEMSEKMELENRKENEDFRIQMFQIKRNYYIRLNLRIVKD